jgi:hypothetical protein
VEEAGPLRWVLQFFRSPAAGTSALLEGLRQRADELGRQPSVREIVILRDDRDLDRLASLHAIGDGPGGPNALARVALQAAGLTEAGLVSEPPAVRPLVTLWERDFDAEAATMVIAEIVTHPSTWRRFADLLMPLALRVVGEFQITGLRVCHVLDEPARFFVIAQFPDRDAPAAYVASSFRRDEVLPTIGPYLAERVRRYTLTPVWRLAPPAAPPSG